MALDRTWYHALVDDDGSNTVGSVWGKDDIANLLNSVDAELGRLDTVRMVSLARAAGNPQSLTNGVWNFLAFDSIIWNAGFTFTAGQDSVTAPVAGLYLVTASAFISANATGSRQLRFYVNRSPTTGRAGQDIIAPGGSLPTLLQSNGVLSLGAGESVQVVVYQDSGVALTAGGGTAQASNTLTVQRLSNQV
jgi:hypothetical protein